MGSPRAPVLPPSDEGGGKPEGLDGGRDTASLKKAGCPERTGCEFSPSVACGDSSLLIAGVSAETPGGAAPRAARDLTGGTMFLP